jgi:hypothetical protein
MLLKVSAQYMVQHLPVCCVAISTLLHVRLGLQWLPYYGLACRADTKNNHTRVIEKGS